MDFTLFYEDSEHLWLQAITPAQAVSTIGGFMEFADSDGSGFITIEEFYVIFDLMGPWAEEANAAGLDENQVAAYDSTLVFANLNTDSDTDLISYEEWFNHLSAP